MTSRISGTPYSSPSSPPSDAIGLQQRTDLIAVPIELRGQVYWNLKDPVSSRYFQLRDEEYYLLQQVSPHATLAGLAQTFRAKFPSTRVETHQIRAYLGALFRSGLITSTGSGQGDVLFVRGKQIVRSERATKFGNILAIRFRGLDPDTLITAIHRFVRFLFRPSVVLVWIALVSAASTLAFTHWSELVDEVPRSSEWLQRDTICNLAIAISLIKVIHEFAHGLACKHFGGRCRELGLMLLCFTPCLYVNVSDSWLMPNKWHRATIAAAGIVAELTVASLATLAWWLSVPGEFHQLMFHVMGVCSINTLLLNGNPLLRYDGYYVMCDLLEIANLQQRSHQLWSDAFIYWFTGVDNRNERFVGKPSLGLWCYALASLGYRLLMVVSILWFLNRAMASQGWRDLANVVTVVAAIMVGWRPLVAGFGLMEHVRWHSDMRVSRVAKAVMVVSALGLVALFLPFPCRITCPAVVELADGQPIFVSVPGLLQHSTPFGETVQAGDVIARLHNIDLELELAKLRGQRDSLAREVTVLERLQFDRDRDDVGRNATELPTIRKSLEDVDERLRQKHMEYSQLEIRSPTTGKLYPPRRHQSAKTATMLATWNGYPTEAKNHGAFVDRGVALFQVSASDHREVTILISQADLDLVAEAQRVTLELDEVPNRVVNGLIDSVSPGPMTSVPMEFQRRKAIPLANHISGEVRPESTWHQATVRLDRGHRELTLGAFGIARVDVGNQSLLNRIVRAIRQTFTFDG